MAILFRAMLLPRLRPVAVTWQVRVGETLSVLADDGGLRVIETPGHTLGQIALYLPGRRLLFAGDAYRHTARGEIALPFKMFNCDTAQARQSLAALGALAIDVSLPGHGKPLAHGAAEPLARAVKAAERATASRQAG
jgi:glyoxylase-like metal-dependent hydrolase (beta-lactamase superfamily II)